jgi:hypothetical protein
MSNVSVVNAWRLHSLVNNNTKVDLFEFVRETRRIALSEHGPFPKKLSIKQDVQCHTMH